MSGDDLPPLDVGDPLPGGIRPGPGTGHTPTFGEHEEEIARLEAVVKAQAEQLRIFEANCCYRYIELDDRARLTALKEQK